MDPNAAADPNAGLFGLTTSLDDAGVIVLPAPWDATTSYRPGTARGPEAVLGASHQVDLYDVETGRPYLAGIAMLEGAERFADRNRAARAQAEIIIEAGGASENTAAIAAEVDRATRELLDWLRAEAERWLERGKLVAVLGGDHSVPESLIAAIGDRFPGFGILHFDAHADLREAYEGFRHSHASIMFNVLNGCRGLGKLVQVGIRDVCEAEIEVINGSQGRVETFFDSQLAAAQLGGATWDSLCRKIVALLPENVYVSFDIDALDPALCPNTGTPVPGGLSFHQATYLLRVLGQSGRRIVGFDLVEVAPGQDEWDANVGARLLYKMIGWSLITNRSASQPRR